MPIILLNKPYRVLCQFRDDRGRDTLANHVDQPDVYPAGRLDYDTEGLVILTDDGTLQARISEPRYTLDKHYWTQVDGAPDAQQLEQLITGVMLKDGLAKALSVTRIDEPPGLWQRTPPIRYRASLPTRWIDLSLSEGRNRQVRRMTAAVGLPTLRLIRHRVGPWSLDGLQPGESRCMETEVAWRELRDYR